MYVIKQIKSMKNAQLISNHAHSKISSSFLKREYLFSNILAVIVSIEFCYNQCSLADIL